MRERRIPRAVADNGSTAYQVVCNGLRLVRGSGMGVRGDECSRPGQESRRQMAVGIDLAKSAQAAVVTPARHAASRRVTPRHAASRRVTAWQARGSASPHSAARRRTLRITFAHPTCWLFCTVKPLHLPSRPCRMHRSHRRGGRVCRPSWARRGRRPAGAAPDAAATAPAPAAAARRASVGRADGRSSRHTRGRLLGSPSEGSPTPLRAETRLAGCYSTSRG